jgi:hypothetical protein
VVDDQQARDYYLKGVVVPSVLPSALLDASSMESLPVLSEHYVASLRVAS